MQGKLHQYHLTKELAQKYSHVTYLAAPTEEPERYVLLKLFPSSLFRFSSEREKLLSKAQRLKNLDHSHLLPLLDMGIEHDQPFVVREYVTTDSLRSHLRERSPGSLELQEALSIVSQVGSALACAHERSIVHGSLQPENILLDGGGQAVVTDFHLMNHHDTIIRDQTTKEYAFCYLAPEQFAGRTTAKSDQYALGCLAYELITGQVPFAAQSLVSMMGYHSHTEPVPLSEKRADVPPSLEVAVLKALAKDPEERFDDFLLFLEVIQSMVLSSPAFPFTGAPHACSTKALSSSSQSATAEGVVSPIRKRAAKRSVRQQPKSSQALHNVVTKGAEPMIPPALSATSMPEWAGIISPSESLALILQPHQFTSSPSDKIDLASSGENDRPNQLLQELIHQEASEAMLSAFDSHEIGTRAREYESREASKARVTSPDTPNSVGSPCHDNAVFPSEGHTASRRDAQEDTDDGWLTSLFAEQEKDDQPPTESAILGQDEDGREKKQEIIISLLNERERHLRRQTQHNRRKVLGLMLLCIIIGASGTYAAFSLVRPSGHDRLVRPTQVVNQVLIPVQKSISPTQLATPLATPTATAQPTPQITTIPAVIPMPTPIVHQVMSIDDRVVGTGLNQFNYVGSGWDYCAGNCIGAVFYDDSCSWDGTSGDYVTLTFRGTQIKFYGALDPVGGIGAVSIDGGSEVMIDLYGPNKVGDKLMWTSPMLPAGTHTFKLRNTGIKDSRSTNDYDYYVEVDRVDILS